MSRETRDVSYPSGWRVLEGKSSLTILTKDKEERHQVPVKLAAYMSRSKLIVFDGTLQLSSFPLANTVQVKVCHR